MKVQIVASHHQMGKIMQEVFLFFLFEMGYQSLTQNDLEHTRLTLNLQISLLNGLGLWL